MINPFDCVSDNNIKDLRMYLTDGDINVLDDKKQSLLHLAVRFNTLEIFEFLLDNAIDMNISDIDGNTPLILCVFYNRIGFFKTLLKKEASYNKRNNLGESAFYRACLLNRCEMISVLEDYNAVDLSIKNINDEGISFAVIRSQNIALINKYEQLLKVNEDKNYFDESLLHIAVKTNCFYVVEYLLKKKAYVNSKNKFKETPLFYAVRNQNREISSLLFKYGAIAEILNRDQETIFDFIDSHSFIDYIEEKMTSYSYLEYKRCFPLHYYIVMEDYFEVTKYLNNRNINRSDTFGYLPKQLVKYIVNPQIEKLVMNYK